MFESNVRMLYGQIEQVLRQNGAEEFHDAADGDCEPTTMDEATEELARLRDDLAAPAQQAAQFAVADTAQPAPVPAGVPKLPPRFQSTEHIRELIRIVLSTTAQDMAMSRVGFFGMGGGAAEPSPRAHKSCDMSELSDSESE